MFPSKFKNQSCCPPRGYQAEDAAPSERLLQGPSQRLASHPAQGYGFTWRSPCVRGVPVVAVQWWREAHRRLRLRVGGRRHVALVAHGDNTIPGDSSASEPCNRRHNRRHKDVSVLGKGSSSPFLWLEDGCSHQAPETSRTPSHTILPYKALTTAPRSSLLTSWAEAAHCLLPGRPKRFTASLRHAYLLLPGPFPQPRVSTEHTLGQDCVPA